MKVINVSTLPKKRIMNPYFPWSRNRIEGKYSIPFNGLDCGIFDIRFETKTEFLECQIKHWLSMYGYAWEITKIFSTGKISIIEAPQIAPAVQ